MAEISSRLNHQPIGDSFTFWFGVEAVCCVDWQAEDEKTFIVSLSCENILSIIKCHRKLL